jgi:glyoxylase-like metal-dependent hydrolase (beta-lactamase superfamily II)
MHLLRTETVFLDEGASAIDLGQTPADILFLSFSDSDLAGLASAWREGGALYPHAQILIHPDEYHFWMAPNVGGESEKILRQRQRAQLNLSPYRDQMRFVKEGEEILGCTPLLSPGHTPGHTCWRIDAGREAFLAWGDLVHFSAIQIERPDVAVTYDLDPDLARRSRLRFLDIVASERMAVAGAHVAAPGLGYVTRKGTGYSFEPA